MSLARERVASIRAGKAQRVYAAARDPQTLAALAHSDARVVPIALDITDDTSVQAAAARLGDVDLVVNNAGLLRGERLIAAADLAAARQEMEVNYFGLLRMSRAFAPILAANGGGTLINLLSILLRVANPEAGGYSASKAAALSLTQAVRAELLPQGTRVIGVLPGFMVQTHNGSVPCQGSGGAIQLPKASCHLGRSRRDAPTAHQRCDSSQRGRPSLTTLHLDLDAESCEPSSIRFARAAQKVHVTVYHGD